MRLIIGELLPFLSLVLNISKCGLRLQENNKKDIPNLFPLTSKNRFMVRFLIDRVQSDGLAD
ncbi:hypothetical protein GcM3_00417 [Golovinomyces cichoracearum]|uniref:Uncharacterized protein n=1 Tax=Golovinomyces cichoracearum TaxID=62708 RepID=A0A420HMM0_9PEZI|nr:hypothetical protein GcM3_00417 [Golovinomyces cichoracearum]